MNSRWYHQKEPPPQERYLRDDPHMMMMMHRMHDSILPNTTSSSILTMHHTIIRAVVTHLNEQSIRMAQITFTSPVSHDSTGTIDANSHRNVNNNNNNSHHWNHLNHICLDEAYQMLQKTLDYYNNSGGNCNAWDSSRRRNQSQWSTPVSTAHQASHWSEAQHPHSHHGHYEHGTREEDCDPSPKIIITSPQPQPPQSSLPPPIPEAELLRLLPPPPSSSSPLPPVPRTIPLNAHLQAYHTIYDKLPIAIYHHMFTIPLLPSISILSSSSSSSTTMSWDFLLRINDHRLTTAILWYNMALLLHLQCLTLVPSVVVSSTTMSRSKLLQQALHSYHQSYYAILMVQPFASSSSSIATAALEQVTMPLFQQQQQQLQQMQYSTLLKSAVCHNLAVLYQSEYSNMYMALLLRCQLVHTIQEHHQEQQQQQSQDWLDRSARHVRADLPTMTMPPHPVAAGPATTGDGMDVSEYVFFHLGIFFAMINECQLAPAA